MLTDTQLDFIRALPASRGSLSAPDRGGAWRGGDGCAGRRGSGRDSGSAAAGEGGGMIELRYVTRDEANGAVKRWHRHHKPVRSHYLASGAFINGRLVGVVIGGRPNAPALCDGKTIEVTRLATDGAHEHVASRLLGAMWRAAAALGFTRAVSYTRADEAGTCYRAAGWVRTATVKGREWAGQNKPGRWLALDGVSLFEPTTETVDRVRWEIGPARMEVLNG